MSGWCEVFDVQKLIAGYDIVTNGSPLFFSNSDEWRASESKMQSKENNQRKE